MVILRCQGVFVFFYDFLCTTAAMRSFFMPGKIKVYVLKIPLPSGHKKRVPAHQPILSIIIHHHQSVYSSLPYHVILGSEYQGHTVLVLCIVLLAYMILDSSHAPYSRSIYQ